jgi:hypothetical protein
LRFRKRISAREDITFVGRSVAYGSIFHQVLMFGPREVRVQQVGLELGHRGGRLDFGSVDPEVFKVLYILFHNISYANDGTWGPRRRLTKVPR